MKSIKLIIIHLMFVLLIFNLACSDSNSEISLDPTVYYDGHGGLNIYTNNDFPWSNVKLILNYDEDDLSSGYIYNYGDNVGVIGSTYIETWEFYNSEGEQFRWWEGDPINLYIQAENAFNGEKGSYLKTW